MIKFVFFIFVCNTLCSVYGGIPEGSPCVATDGHPGTCTQWKKCLTLVIDHQNYEYPTTCSFVGFDPIICCTSCKLTDDVTKAVLHPLGGFLWKNDQKSWNKCIEYFVSLPYEIKRHCGGSVTKSWSEKRGCFALGLKGECGVGGRDANRNEFPHMALIGYGPTLETAQYLCAGTLLSDRFILTAAHCISSPSLGPVKYAALGMLKRSDPDELWQRHRVERIIPHPQYRSPIKYHDIALLRTATFVIFDQNVLPACLPNLAEPLSTFQATVTGWGAMGPDSDLADTLQAVPLTEFSKSNCSNQYKKHRHLRRGYDHNIQMCYGDHEVERDTCKGDSGAPLQVRGSFRNSPPTIIGVTSYGAVCARRGQAGVYTRVEPYVHWIDSVVWK